MASHSVIHIEIVALTAGTIQFQFYCRHCFSCGTDENTTFDFVDIIFSGTRNEHTISLSLTTIAFRCVFFGSLWRAHKNSHFRFYLHHEHSVHDNDLQIERAVYEHDKAVKHLSKLRFVENLTMAMTIHKVTFLYRTGIHTISVIVCFILL